jgi:hypothetical protein
MENSYNVVTVASAVCVAGYGAITLWYVTLYDLGLSRQEVRTGATIIAIVIAAFVAIDFVGEKLRKAK